MKIKKLRPVALALGVFLGRGAQADTVLNFEAVPTEQPNLDRVVQAFGDYASASSPGVGVTGFGTPNIGLTWRGVGEADTQWDYYFDGGSVWNAIQLNDSAVGTKHTLTFTPNDARTRVVIKSFNFHPYYVSLEKFTYNVSILSGTNVLTTVTNIAFVSDAAKHLVSVNYTGAPSQILRLELSRVASTLVGGEFEGNAYDIAVDDITFAQLPESVQTPALVSTSISDGDIDVPANKPYVASITNAAPAVVVGSIQLRLDGNLVSPAPVISSSGGLTNVSFTPPNLLTSGSTHVYTLSFTDNGAPAASFTNEVQFTVATYPTLPTSYALPLGAGVVRGFTFRTVSANLEATAQSPVPNNVAEAKAQLAGTLINTNTSQPYTNSAVPGPNSDGSYNVDTVIDFDDDGRVSGNFTNDTVPFPGLPIGPNNYFSSDALGSVELQPGYYRLGVNSDDGFELSVLPPQGVAGTPIVLGIYDTGRGAADSLFDVYVQKAGLYNFRLVFFEIGGFASVELFSYDLTSGQKTLINDTNAAALKSYRVLKPLITSIGRSGSNVGIQWAYGVPPFQVQVATNLSSPIFWNNSGGTTSNRTATVPITGSQGYIRVFGQ